MPECAHPGYIVVDGILKCIVCGEPSPKVTMTKDGTFIPKPQKAKCPHCKGEVLVHIESGAVKRLEAVKPADAKAMASKPAKTESK